MKRRMLLLFGVALLAIVTSGCGYNTLQTKHQNVKAKWSDVENQLQRRADLIPNMISAAQSVAVNEQEVFGQVNKANTQLINATSAQPQGEGGERTPIIDAANSFGGTIGRLLSLQQAYPTLHSNENFMRLQDELAGTENRLAVARHDYNEAVQDYNTTRGNFPMVISAKIFGFKEEPYFKAAEGAQQAPTFNPNSLRQNQGNANAR